MFFPERNEWYEIAYPDPSATNRPNFHLIRLQPGSILLAGARREEVGEEPEDSLIWSMMTALTFTILI